MKPRLLDLFCGAGGAARGYQLAGFYVTGIDLHQQPRYVGDDFFQADALEFLADTEWAQQFDAIHASPPCQSYIRSGMVAKDGRHPDLLGQTRYLLEQTGLPYVIENVPGAPMRPDIVLCGSMFGLGIRRHRWFEINVLTDPMTLCCDHSRAITGVYGHPHGKGGAYAGMLSSDADTWSREMGIDWMTPPELAQAIPPAYTEHIGQLLMAHLRDPVAA